MCTKSLLMFVFLISACAGAPRNADSPEAPGDVYEVVNLSSCTARIVLHDLDGHVITHIKFEDLPAGRSARYRLPSRAMRLSAVAVDAMRNACGMVENEKVKVTMVQ